MSLKVVFLITISWGMTEYICKPERDNSEVSTEVLTAFQQIKVPHFLMRMGNECTI